jgi:hypothetical protein
MVGGPRGVLGRGQTCWSRRWRVCPSSVPWRRHANHRCAPLGHLPHATIERADPCTRDTLKKAMCISPPRGRKGWPAPLATGPQLPPRAPPMWPGGACGGKGGGAGPVRGSRGQPHEFVTPFWKPNAVAMLLAGLHFCKLGAMNAAVLQAVPVPYCCARAGRVALSPLRQIPLSPDARLVESGQAGHLAMKARARRVDSHDRRGATGEMGRGLRDDLTHGVVQASDRSRCKLNPRPGACDARMGSIRPVQPV